VQSRVDTMICRACELHEHQVVLSPNDFPLDRNCFPMLDPGI